MNIILVTGILLIAISLLTEKKYKPYVGFAFVLLIMGFQSGVEGDFMSYQDTFNFIAQSGRIDRTVESEPLFWILMKLFSWMPWWLFLFIISFFQVYILYIFVRKYTVKEYQFLSAILFFFTFNMMLMQMKALRQGFAIELMMLAFIMIDVLKQKKWLCVIPVLLSYLTHNSSLIIAPFILLYYIVNRYPHLLTKENWKKNKSSLFPLIMTGIYFFMYFVKMTFLNQYLAPLVLLSAGDEARFAGYFDPFNTREGMENNLNEISLLIVLYDALIVYLVSWYYRGADSRMRVFCWISIVAAFGDMLFFGAGTLPRMFMYYNVFNLAVYPAIAEALRKRYGPVVAMFFIVLLFGYAIKTSLPWIVGTDEGRFGTYQFVFW